MSSSSSSSGGIGFVGLLKIVFITLKLCGVITWSWFYVLLPIIISTALVCFCLYWFVFVFIGLFLSFTYFCYISIKEINE